ncbi:GNAT family N-acetyltransferase [Chryseobacterium sp.]|uniref:GNAT family N-acetyltransferase n=1 Tax=Chryseobacterium sp. TaxID=1871047 RepID=UPI0025B81623|nr:GNAT family N-acetyltransferase [Chryseobacterium sp.]
MKLAFYTEEDLPLLSYELDDIQVRYTATPEQALQRIKDKNSTDAYAVTIFYNEKAVGFFVLDFGEDKLDLTENPDSVLLRSLSVNPKFQGKGLGKFAMLEVVGFIRKHFKNCNEIVLAVNQKNDSAYHLYLKTGYVFNGKTRIGRNGVQYLMCKEL